MAIVKPWDRFKPEYDESLGRGRQRCAKQIGASDNAVHIHLDLETNDTISALAEKWVCTALGLPFHFLGLDGGKDGILNGMSIDVKMSPFAPWSDRDWGTPRHKCHLIKNRNQPHWTDLYVAVKGFDWKRARICGYARREDFERTDIQTTWDFGYGETKAILLEHLRPFEELMVVAGTAQVIEDHGAEA